MSVHKLKRTGDYLDKDLESPFHHQHLTGAGENVTDNLAQLNEIDAEFIKRVKSGLAESNLSNVELDTFAEKVKDTGLTFEDTSKDNIPYIRINQSWQELHKSQIVTELDADSDYIELKSDFTKVEVASGRPIHYYHFTLKDDIVRAIKDVDNKLNNLGFADQSGMLATVNADGTLSRSTTDIGTVLVRSDITSSFAETSKTIPASAYLTSELYDSISGLAANKSSCKNTVANAYDAQLYYGIKKVSIANPGLGYAVGDVLHIDIPGTHVAARIRVTSVNTGSTNMGAITSVEIRDIIEETVEGREITIPAEYGFYSESLLSYVGTTFKAIGGIGNKAQFTVEEVTPEANQLGTTLSSIEKWGETPLVGDFVIVAHDECHNFEPTVYLYVEVDTGFTRREMWMYIQTLSGGVDILRYGDDA